MSDFSGCLAITSMFVSIVSGIPSAIRGWYDLVWRKRRNDAICDDTILPSSPDDDQPIAEFSPSSGQRDFTRYSLNGYGSYGKGRLVLAVIKKYAENRKGITYAELTQAFPKQLRGVKNERSYWGCLNLKSDAVTLFHETGIRRHYLQPEDILTLEDGTEVAVSSQWGIGNIDAFIKKAKEIGFQIEVVDK